MVNFHYFHPADNVAPNATVTTSGTENSAYPLTNATDLSFAQLAAPALIAEATGRFIFDFGSAQRVDAAIVWHDFAPGLSASWKAHATNAFGSPTTLNAPIVPPAKLGDDHTVKIYTDFTGATGYSPAGFRYWALDVAGTNDVPLGIKVALFSRIRTISTPIERNPVFTDQQAGIRQVTPALSPWRYGLGRAPDLFQGSVRAIGADATALRNWFSACGVAKPTLLVLNPATAPEPYWGLMNGTAGDVAGAQGGGVSSGVDKFAGARNVDVTPFRFTIESFTAVDPEWT